MSLAEYSIAWLLSRQRVASVIVGSRSAEQLDVAVSAVERCIPSGHFERIDAISPPPKPFGDEKVLRWSEHGWVLEDQE